MSRSPHQRHRGRDGLGTTLETARRFARRVVGVGYGFARGQQEENEGR